MSAADIELKIAADLANLGVSPGQTILVHSSFKSLGPVGEGAIETVIRGLLRAVGPDGTLAMPALCWGVRPPEVFDQRTTRTVVGAIPEFFRTRPGTRRSLHPRHSVCAVGKRVADLLDDHYLDATPCGVHSPFQKIARSRGKIVMLGCGLEPNTTMHALEEIAGAPYVLGSRHVFTLRDADGRITIKEYHTHGFGLRALGQRYDRVLELDTDGFLRRGKVLQAQTLVLDAPGLKTAVLRKMAEEPYFFVERYGLDKRA